MTIFKDPDFEHYRKCVGIMIIHPDGGKILAFERSDEKGAWQLPQGGVNEGEDELFAARRELLEETGLRKEQMELVALHPEWIGYDIPEKIIKKKKFSHKGQVQKWFAFVFRDQDKNIDLSKAEDQEFKNWKWVTPEDLEKNIVDFKKEAYSELLAHFKNVISTPQPA